MPMEGVPSQWKVRNRYISNAKMYIKSEKVLYGLIPQLQKIYYVAHNSINLV